MREFLWLCSIFIFSSCEKSVPIDENLGCEATDQLELFGSREFYMGFTSWPYAPSLEAVDDTYGFLEEFADIYSEHIDMNIPWQAWINDLSITQHSVNGYDRLALKIACCIQFLL